MWFILIIFISCNFLFIESFISYSTFLPRINFQLYISNSISLLNTWLSPSALFKALAQLQLSSSPLHSGVSETNRDLNSFLATPFKVKAYSGRLVMFSILQWGHTFCQRCFTPLLHMEHAWHPRYDPWVSAICSVGTIMDTRGRWWHAPHTQSSLNHYFTTITSTLCQLHLTAVTAGTNSH